MPFSPLRTLLACLGLSPLSAQEPAPQDLSPLLHEVITEARIPGAAALVLRGDRVIARGVAGVRKRESDIPVTIVDQWGIASGSKAVTATAVAALVAAGSVSWDTTLADLLPTDVADLHSAWRPVTLRQLLTHTAGARDRRIDFLRLAGDSSGDLVAQRQAYLNAIVSRPPATPPGTAFFYCNTSILIAAAALEQHTGQTIEDLLRAHVFEPLGLDSAGFGPPGSPGTINQPWGHGSRWLRYLPLPFTSNTPLDPGSLQADYPAAANPAGRIHLSLPDWARFATLHLRGNPANPHRQAHGSLDFVTLHQPAPGTD